MSYGLDFTNSRLSGIKSAYNCYCWWYSRYNKVIKVIINFKYNELIFQNEAFEKINNQSESDEDENELLSEYHHYLEKAHKQRFNYLEKNKRKNKVPNFHHEELTKFKSPIGNKHNDFYKNGFITPDQKFPSVLNPFNMFIPFNSNKYMTATEQPAYNNDHSAIKKIMMIDESPMSPFPSIPLKPPCICKDGRTTCKKCFMPLDHTQQKTNTNVMLSSDDTMINNPTLTEPSDDTINVRIKVDVQLPKFQQDRVQYYNPQSRNKMTDYDFGLSKEFLSAIKIPSPYFNFPIPMNLLGYKKVTSNKMSKHDTQTPLHKIPIHKKKKTKVGNVNKKHRKKVITFHNIKIEPELSYAMFNMSGLIKNNTDSNNTFTLNLLSNNTQNQNLADSTTTNTTVDNFDKSEHQTEENVLLPLSITNNIENRTNENNKTENSIETEYTNAIINSTTDKPSKLPYLRGHIRKREISVDNKYTTPKDMSTTGHKEKSTYKYKSSTPKPISTMSVAPPTQSNTSIKSNTAKNKAQKKSMPKKATAVIKKKNSTKTLAQKAAKNNTTLKLGKEKSHTKLDKNLPTDWELLYWPNINSTKTKEIVKDITAIILENENKKAKLNMSKETMHRNHTRALEQAIFGNVDWNDIDAVAPAFISFVGKYIEGILTFCNERVCHSMKCTKKNCIHRFCAPKDRYNKGHCTGSNFTGKNS